MALSAKAGTFSLNTSTGNQSVTGLGFQPKAIIFIGTNLTADGAAANATVLFGFAVSSTVRAAMGVRGFDGSNPTDASKAVSGAKCLMMANASDTTIVDADLVTMDADGFTINITTTDGTAYKLNYIALGGSDITNATVLAFDTKTTTGSQAYTGAGFQPDAIFLMSSSAASVPLNNNSALAGIGFGTSSSARGAIGIRIGATVVNQVDEKTQRTTKILEETNGGAVFISADLTSLDADGFTLNYATVSGTARKSYALCLKGGQYKVGSFNQATGTGNQGTTGVGFQPTGLILASFNAATTTSIVEDSKTSIGAASSTSARFALWAGDEDNVSPQQSNSRLDTDEIITMYSHADTPTLDAEADLVTFDSDGFTLNWTTADATAREILYLAVGSTPSASSIKTVDGLAKASVKTVNGLAIASVKSYEGLQ